MNKNNKISVDSQTHPQIMGCRNFLLLNCASRISFIAVYNRAGKLSRGATLDIFDVLEDQIRYHR